jgi:hypothetical protein
MLKKQIEAWKLTLFANTNVMSEKSIVMVDTKSVFMVCVS